MAIKSGWLYKTPPNITIAVGWKKRHFDLFDNGDLAYSRSREHTTVLGLIRLSEVEEIVDAEEIMNCLFVIGLYCPAQKRTLYLRAESRAEIDGWCREIQRFVPNYAHHPPEYRPVYRFLPDEVLDSLPKLAGFLSTPEMDLFAKQKFCAISEGQFRIYNNQSQEHLFRIYSLLCCKGVQELTGGKTNSFQFKIEFLNQDKNSLVLSTRSPFERQGWIVCLMKTITILSKFQNSFNLLQPRDSERGRSLSAPSDCHISSADPDLFERQVAEFQEQLARKEAIVLELRDDKLVLSNKLDRLIRENKLLKGQRPLSGSESSHLFTPEPGVGSRPSTLPFMAKSDSRDLVESYNSENSGECHFRDCSSTLANPTSSAIVSTPDLVQVQLFTFCQDLGCLHVDQNTDLIPVLSQYIEELKLDAYITRKEKDEDINALKRCKMDQEKTIGGLESDLTNMRTNYFQLKENTENVEVLKTKLESELEAVKEEKKMLNDQMEEKEKRLLQELEQISAERDKISENYIKVSNEHGIVCTDLNIKTSEIANLRKTLEDKENEIEDLRSMLPKQPKKPPKPPLP